MKRALHILAAASVCGVIAIPHTAAAAAYYFESETTTDGQAMNVRAWLDGPNAKIEFVDGEIGFFQEGSYMLTSSGAQIVYIVNPEEMTYSEFDLDALLTMANTMLNAVGGIVNMEFADVVNEKLSEGPGGDILGYSTTRYEHRTGFTINMSVMGFKNSTRNDTQQETWCTTEIDAEGVQAWLSPDRIRTGNPEFDELIKAGYADMGNCMPLRMRSTTTSSGDRGRDSTTVSTTEVTVLREEPSIDPVTFQLPPGYTLQPLLPEMPAGFTLPEGASGEAEEAPEEGRDRPRLRLRDLIRP